MSFHSHISTTKIILLPPIPAGDSGYHSTSPYSSPPASPTPKSRKTSTLPPSSPLPPTIRRSPRLSTSTAASFDTATLRRTWSKSRSREGAGRDVVAQSWTEGWGKYPMGGSMKDTRRMNMNPVNNRPTNRAQTLQTSAVVGGVARSKSHRVPLQPQKRPSQRQGPRKVVEGNPSYCRDILQLQQWSVKQAQIAPPKTPCRSQPVKTSWTPSGSDADLESDVETEGESRLPSGVPSEIRLRNSFRTPLTRESDVTEDSIEFDRRMEALTSDEDILVGRIRTNLEAAPGGGLFAGFIIKARAWWIGLHPKVELETGRGLFFKSSSGTTTTYGDDTWGKAFSHFKLIKLTRANFLPGLSILTLLLLLFTSLTYIFTTYTSCTPSPLSSLDQTLGIPPPLLKTSITLATTYQHAKHLWRLQSALNTLITLHPSSSATTTSRPLRQKILFHSQILRRLMVDTLLTTPTTLLPPSSLSDLSLHSSWTSWGTTLDLDVDPGTRTHKKELEVKGMTLERYRERVGKVVGNMRDDVGRVLNMEGEDKARGLVEALEEEVERFMKMFWVDFWDGGVVGVREDWGVGGVWGCVRKGLVEEAEEAEEDKGGGGSMEGAKRKKNVGGEKKQEWDVKKAREALDRLVGDTWKVLGKVDRGSNPRKEAERKRHMEEEEFERRMYESD